MYQAAPMDLAKRCRQTNRDLQDVTQVEPPVMVPFKNSIQRLTPRVLE
jgi:hypothetical protein